MKKILLIIGGLLLALVIFILIFGVKIGSVTVGHQQNNLAVKQSDAINNSPLFKNYIDKNKLVCINLWATWCNPCVGEIPVLNEIKEEFKKDSMVFLSLSIDTDSARLADFIATKKFSFIHITQENLEYKNAVLNYLENQPLTQEINSQSVPITYLIKNGKIVKKFDGTIEKSELTTAITTLLKD